MLALPPKADPTHFIRTIWYLGNYTFFEAAKKPEPSIARGVYFVAYRGEWVSRESFSTLENAMLAAAEFGAAHDQ
jgi:hypothetical protein